MRCPQCGYIQIRSEECVRCGKTLTSLKPRRSVVETPSGIEPGKRLLSRPLYIPSCSFLEDKKDPTAAAWLNFFFPGLGYIYIDRNFLGVSLLLIFISCIIGASIGIYALLPVSIGMSLLCTLASYMSVKKHNRALNGHGSRTSSDTQTSSIRHLNTESSLDEEDLEIVDA
ncbi:MAG: hypothetical protein LAO21_20810 [Acidobacteriia bacterium]|nr:hypothetical protein [Terriglobia bacterium]